MSTDTPEKPTPKSVLDALDNACADFDHPATPSSAAAEPIAGPCTYCGNPDHWRPDCPEIAKVVKEERERRRQTLEKLAQCCVHRRGHFDPPETREEQAADLANDLEITCLLAELGIIKGEKEPLIWMRRSEYQRLHALEQQLAAVTASLAAEEKSHLATIDQRDAAEDAADRLTSEILGEPVDWAFHDAKWKEALEVVGGIHAKLAAVTADRDRLTIALDERTCQRQRIEELTAELREVGEEKDRLGLDLEEAGDEITAATERAEKAEATIAAVRRHVEQRRYSFTEQLKHARKMGHFNIGLELDSRLAELTLLATVLGKGGAALLERVAKLECVAKGAFDSVKLEWSRLHGCPRKDELLKLLNAFEALYGT